VPVLTRSLGAWFHATRGHLATSSEHDASACALVGEAETRDAQARLAR
jgi:hypothetical protein